MPPINFFGSLGNTNLFRRHGTSPRLLLKFADEIKVPGARLASGSGGNIAWPYFCCPT